VFVLQLQHLLVRLEEERGLAVRERHDCGLSSFAATEQQKLLCHRERLGHVSKALHVRQALDRLLHLRHVRSEWQDVLRVSYRAIRQDLAIAKLHNANLHILEPKPLAMVLVDENGGEVLEDLEALLSEGAAAVNGQDEVLLGDADLVTLAPVRVALLQSVPEV